MCSFQGLSGNDIRHMTKEDFHLSCCARRFSSCSFSWEKSWMFCFVRTDIDVSRSALRVSCRPSLLSVKMRVYCSSFFVVVCSFQGLSGNNIRHMTKEDFRLSCCARRFSSCSFSWEKSWMFCENWHRRERVRALRVVQAFFVACKKAGLLFKLFRGHVFVSRFVWEWDSLHDWRRLSFIVLCKKF